MQPKADAGLKATAMTANVVMLHFILKGAAARCAEAHELFMLWRRSQKRRPTLPLWSGIPLRTVSGLRARLSSFCSTEQED